MSPTPKVTHSSCCGTIGICYRGMTFKMVGFCNKPTPPGTNSAPLPPPAAAPMSGLSAALGRYGGAQVMSMTATIFFLAS
ncbi:hypothetical protein V6N13_118872 [Hibiscus sabdariffa]